MKHESDSSNDENEIQTIEQVRQDLYVVFTNEKELKSCEQVKNKIRSFTGIVVKLKSVTEKIMQILL